MSVAGADGDNLDPVRASSTVLVVYERLLGEILTGARPPGEPLRDREIAVEFGVSRTPVREAIQMLRQVGVVEARASRYTRVAALGPRDIAESWRLGLAVYGEVMRDFLDAGGKAPFAAMERSLRAAERGLRHGDLQEFWLRLFEMHDHAIRCITNPHLLRAVQSVNYAFRVAVIANPEFVDATRMLRASRAVLDAIRDGDDELLRSAVADFTTIGAELPAWRTVAP